MYEAVHAHPDGQSTLRRLAVTVREYGFDGVVVRNHDDLQTDDDAAAVAEETGVDVVRGVEIDADGPEQASGYLGNYRPDYTVVAIRGGTEALNRFAVEQPAVDVLARPMAEGGDVDHVLAAAAAENGVHVEVNLRPVLRETGGSRVRAIADLEKLRTLIEDAGAPFVVSADPHSHLELRASRELCALGAEIGFEAERIEEGLRAWGDLATRNRDRQSGAFIEPGVRSGRYEEDST